MFAYKFIDWNVTEETHKIGWMRETFLSLFTFFLLFAESFEPCKFILVNNFKIKIKNNSIPKTVNIWKCSKILYFERRILASIYLSWICVNFKLVCTRGKKRLKRIIPESKQVMLVCRIWGDFSPFLWIFLFFSKFSMMNFDREKKAKKQVSNMFVNVYMSLDCP